MRQAGDRKVTEFCREVRIPGDGGRTMTGPTRRTRLLVIARDKSVCQWCGEWVETSPGWYSLQHRRARMMGGSRLDWINQASNLVLICGTGTTQCHGFIEAHPLEAAGRGFRLSVGQYPSDAPLEDWAGRRWLLGPDAGKRPYEIGEEVSNGTRSSKYPTGSLG